jgi:SAM-dependent methyltransferase
MKKAISIFFAVLLGIIPTANLAVSQQPNPYTGDQGGVKQYEPYVGQQGKDVIWVPTAEALVEAMLDMAGVTPSDYVIDLGSGDGRIVIAAAKRGARAVGYEFNPDMVELSRTRAAAEGVSDRASFVKADIFASDFSQATVITMYLLPQLNLKLRPIILKLKPGTRIVSHAFDMGDWTADQTIEQEYRKAFLWIVPAKVEGTWKWTAESGPAELQLTQTYQRISGSLKANGQIMEIQDGKIEGDQIRFGTGEMEYAGRINGRSIKGTVKKNGTEKPWAASLL